jgi:hypothetical protein
LFYFVEIAIKKNEIKQENLLFQNTGTGEIDNAIKEVTATLFSKSYSHAR